MSSELPLTSARALAQRALQDENLFDTLVAQGAIESSLKDPAFQAALAIPHRRKYWAIALPATAAAAGLVAFFALRPSQPVQQPIQQARTIVPKPAVAPTILLPSDLQPANKSVAPLFRGDNSATRAPRIDGTIISIDNGVATVNLGSIDGLAKGTELSIIRDGSAGHIVITTVFRDRARGKIISTGAARIDDQVRVPGPAHLDAILQQVNALSASGSLKAARDLARSSVTAGSAGETRQLLERLAALDYQAGAPDAARERYEVAVDNFDQPPSASSAERAHTLASFGALLLQHGDQARAQEHLQKALTKATDPDLRSEILNNLGAAAELRGDSVQAAAYYNQARGNGAKHP